MAFRFRRRIPIMPGIRVNVSKKGLSLSGGVRGASVTAGQHGLHGNVGAPGTGLSYRTRLNQSKAHQRREAHHQQAQALSKGVRELTIEFVMQDNGEIEVVETSGNPLSTADQRTVKRNYAEALQSFLDAKLAELDSTIKDIRQIHEDTPCPDTPPPSYTPESFSEPEPTPPRYEPEPPEPVPPKPSNGLLGKLIPGFAKRAQQRYQNRYAQWQHDYEQWQQQGHTLRLNQAQAKAQFDADHESWRARELAHQAEQAALAVQFEQDIQSNRAVMEAVLSAELDGLDWPLPLDIDFDIGLQAKVAWLDVGLAADEHWPQQSARMGARGDRLVLKTMSEKDQRLLAAQFAHGLVLRLSGVALASLPGIEQVVVSVYRNQVNPATGYDEDAYWLSVKVSRDGFNALNFSDLSRVDPIAAVSAFEARRNMTATGRFKPIQPYAP